MYRKICIYVIYIHMYTWDHYPGCYKDAQLRWFLFGVPPQKLRSLKLRVQQGGPVFSGTYHLKIAYSCQKTSGVERTLVRVQGFFFWV